MCGSCSVQKLRCAEVAVCGSFGVQELRCGGVTVCGSCGVRRSQCVGVAMFEGCTLVGFTWEACGFEMCIDLNFIKVK